MTTTSLEIPKDDELLRRIHTVAEHLSGNPSLIEQLISSHGGDESLSFIQPSNGPLYRYFQFALKCKQNDVKSDPAAIAAAEMKQKECSSNACVVFNPVVPKLDVIPVSEKIYAMMKILEEFSSHVIPFMSEGLLDEKVHHVIAKKFDFVDQTSSIAVLCDSTLSKLSECVSSFSSTDFSAICVSMLVQASIKFGVLDQSLGDDQPKLSCSCFLMDGDGLLTTSTFTKAMGILSLLLVLYLSEDRKSVDMSSLWLNGSLPWAFRLVTLLGDAARRKAFDNEEAVQEKESQPLSTPTSLVPFDLLVDWMSVVKHRFSSLDTCVQFNLWRLSPRPPCSYDNSIRTIQDRVLYRYPRKEVVKQYKHKHTITPYLRPLPSDLASPSSFGKVPHSGTLNESRVVSTDRLPVGLMVSILQLAKENSRYSGRGGSSSSSHYEVADVPPGGIPGMHPFPPARLQDTVKICLNEMKDIIVPGSRRKVYYDQFEDDDCNPPPIDDVLSGVGADPKPDPHRQEVSVVASPKCRSSKRNYNDRPPPHEASGGSQNGYGNTKMLGKKSGLGMQLSQSQERSGRSDLFETFRARRSGSYHQSIIDYKCGQTTTTGLRCYVCQQTGHFAKDCKFGLN
eukprot:GHVH01016193.1.p1 GENE.GHVH01016193.1~~GHVH01016193.1.p1  ORF type:complete len:622 (+),score=72.62 GHVH01016193.1:49-1914(+)